MRPWLLWALKYIKSSFVHMLLFLLNRLSVFKTDEFLFMNLDVWGLTQTEYHCSHILMVRKFFLLFTLFLYVCVCLCLCVYVILVTRKGKKYIILKGQEKVAWLGYKKLIQMLSILFIDTHVSSSVLVFQINIIKE